MAVDFKELDVSEITAQINSFWSANLFRDKHITDQLWRGYLYVMQNFYTQLYQLARARGINTFPKLWYSHWERFEFNEDNKVSPWNPLYPYAYKLPKYVKSVYVLRESPREVTVLPEGTVIRDNGKIILPDGTERLPEDTIVSPKNLVGFTIVCPTCGGFGDYLGQVCPTCNGIGTVSGTYASTGVAVETVKYLKRADNISDSDETTAPTGDFICSSQGLCGDEDAEQYYIAFAEKPYPVLYSQYVVRNTELIYETFGSMLGYYKKDSAKYLREVQTLWYAMWNGSTFSNIKSGLTALSGLPIVVNPGYITNIEKVYDTGEFNFKATPAFLSDPTYILPSEPKINATTGEYELAIVSPELSNYTFTYGLDFTVVSEYDDTFSGSVPGIHPIVKLIINTSGPVASMLQANDTIHVEYVEQTSSFTITVSGQEYYLPEGIIPDVYLNQYVKPFSTLTDSVKVYDYINFPEWWKSILPGINIFDPTNSSARLRFDSGIKFDRPDSHFDSSDKGNLASAEMLQYNTFLVLLDEEATPHTKEELEKLKAFLDLIKPAYSTYIIIATIAFDDDADARDIGFHDSELHVTPVERATTTRTFDSVGDLPLDSQNLDESDTNETMSLTNITGEYILNDDVSPGSTYDSTAGNSLDSGDSLDSGTTGEDVDIEHT